MVEKFEKIIKIKSGVFAKSDANPNLYYIQSTDFDKQRQWNKALNPILFDSSKFTSHILNVGDILFASKGRNFFAVVYDGQFQPAVASTTFLVLKVQYKSVVAEYVAWFLNHPKTQTLLWSLAKGSAIPSISKSNLEQIEIPIPNITKQNAILELQRLQQKERKLHKQIIKLRQDYINFLTYKLIK
jgi:restriction endonuclease S subunit